MDMAYPGYQRIIAINDHPLYLQGEFEGEPNQPVEPRFYVQGGPRVVIYFLGEKLVKGRFRVPISMTPGQGLDPAIHDLLAAAEYPMSDNRINTNYVWSNYGITADNNRGFGHYSRLAYENIAITDLTIEVPNKGAVTVDVQFMAMITESEAGVVPNPSVSSLMRRNLVSADCDVRLEDPPYEWETTRSLTLNVKNKIDPIVIVRSYVSRTDQPEFLAMGSSEVWGEISYSVDRGTIYDEQASLPSGGWFGRNLAIDFGGLAIARFLWPIMQVTNQPIKGTDLLQRKTRFLAGFASPALSETLGHFFEFSGSS